MKTRRVSDVQPPHHFIFCRRHRSTDTCRVSGSKIEKSRPVLETESKSVFLENERKGSIRKFEIYIITNHI